jgi:hypothetical protein
MCIPGIKHIRLSWNLKMASRRLHYDLALKGKVIAYAEKQGSRASGQRHI